MSRIGQKNTNSFGSEMIIIKYKQWNDIDVYFPEYNWTAKHIRYSNFKNGNIKCPYEPRYHKIGYLGEGKYKAYENKKQTKIYSTWNSMLQRCYSEKCHEKHPTYINCTVCNEWLNFQTFAKWYEENYYEIEGQRMNLDKDIISKGNKVYGPNTCVFMPQSINTLFIKCDAVRGDFPIGVSYNKQHKKYVAQCNTIESGRKNLGYYDTSEEAFQAYKTFKENYIKQIADQYMDLIPQSLYNAMINYEVEEDD